MTETFASKNRGWLEPYIRDVAGRMNLSHWKIELAHNDPEDDCLASVSINGQSRTATMRFRDPHGDMDDLRESVVHECVHCHLNDMEAAVLQTEDHFNPATFDIVRRNIHNELETAICAMSRAWSILLPLPIIAEAKEQDAA